MRTECVCLRLNTPLQDILCPALPFQKHPVISTFGHHLSYVHVKLVKQVLTLRTGRIAKVYCKTVSAKPAGPAFHLSASNVPILGGH